MYRGDQNKIDKVLESNIIPLRSQEDLLHLGIARSGGEWFKDERTGAVFRVMTDDKGYQEVKEKRDSILPKLKPCVITIKCCDCEEERIIKAQDRFQTIRCQDCQRLHRLKQRREYLQRRKQNDT